MPHRAEVRTLEMHRDDRIELFFAGVGHHSVAHDPGIVHQDVQTAEQAVWIKAAAWFQSAMFEPLATASPPAAVISSTTLCAALPARRPVIRPAQAPNIIDDDTGAFGGEGQSVRPSDAAT